MDDHEYRRRNIALYDRYFGDEDSDEDPTLEEGSDEDDDVEFLPGNFKGTFTTTSFKNSTSRESLTIDSTSIESSPSRPIQISPGGTVWAVPVGPAPRALRSDEQEEKRDIHLNRQEKYRNEFFNVIEELQRYSEMESESLDEFVAEALIELSEPSMEPSTSKAALEKAALEKAALEKAALENASISIGASQSISAWISSRPSTTKRLGLPIQRSWFDAARNLTNEELMTLRILMEFPEKKGSKKTTTSKKARIKKKVFSSIASKSTGVRASSSANPRTTNSAISRASNSADVRASSSTDTWASNLADAWASCSANAWESTASHASSSNRPTVIRTPGEVSAKASTSKKTTEKWTFSKYIGASKSCAASTTTNGGASSSNRATVIRTTGEVTAKTSTSKKAPGKWTPSKYIGATTSCAASTLTGSGALTSTDADPSTLTDASRSARATVPTRIIFRGRNAASFGETWHKERARRAEYVKKRRAETAERFQALREVVPNSENLSEAEVLENTTEYIKELTKENYEKQKKTDRMKRYNELAEIEQDMLTNFKLGVPIDLVKLERIRLEMIEFDDPVRDDSSDSEDSEEELDSSEEQSDESEELGHFSDEQARFSEEQSNSSEEQSNSSEEQSYSSEDKSDSSDEDPYSSKKQSDASEDSE